MDYNPSGMPQLKEIRKYISKGEGENFIRSLETLKIMASDLDLSPITIRVIDRMLRQQKTSSHKRRAPKRGGIFYKQMAHLQESLDRKLQSHRVVHRGKKSQRCWKRGVLYYSADSLRIN